MWAKLRVLVPFIIAHSVVHKAPLYSLLSLEPNLARITSDWEKTMQETPHRQIHSQDTRVCSRTRRGSAKSALKPRTGRWVQLQLRGRSEEDCTSHTSAGWGWDDGRRRHLGIIAAVWILPFVLLHSSAVVSLFSFSFHVFQQDQMSWLDICLMKSWLSFRDPSQSLWISPSNTAAGATPLFTPESV